MVDESETGVFDGFSPAAAAWFQSNFASPTPPQAKGWPPIAAGEHTLILAPTGSGKTLSAFFWGLDRITSTPRPEDKAKRTRILYISPLRALAVDIEKNLRGPLQGIRLAAERLGEPFTEPSVAIRTGDTPANERRKLATNPPDLLITTPESLYLMLTSKVRETLVGVETVIIDEIHALAATKRGAHLALSLERLNQICDKPPQRIGLSATQRPLSEIARFLGGYEGGTPRPVTIVDTGIRKELDVEVIVPIEDMSRPDNDAGSIWPSIHPRLLELIESHQSTIIFVNARRLAERLATRLNELAYDKTNRAAEAEGSTPLAGREVVKAHHGSLSRTQRLLIEDELKRGDLPGIVATSSLELGIDMGAVDLVIQVESPGAVGRGLQRIGRAGHQVGAPSVGKMFPKHRADLVEAAVVVDRMIEGLIEETHYPRNPLDVLAQQIVATVAMDEWAVDDLRSMTTSAANFADLSGEVFDSTLDLLAGRYPSDEFAELRPRIIWDRIGGKIRGRPGAQRLAVTSGGTIPDRGLFGVFLPDGTRVGELDEEMVYESRVGETFLLGASTWRIEDITHDRVVVTPFPGRPGKMPFWHGDGPGRPLELGRAIGTFLREIRELDRDAATERLMGRHRLDAGAAKNLLDFLDEQIEVGGQIPDDSTVVVERFRDEIGDWRVCILTPFGSQVHAPWGMALQNRLAEQWGWEAELMWSDDGIVIRLPEALDNLPVDELLIDPDDLDELLVSRLPSTAMFAARFRECSARALLLPRRRPDRRTPLWQQRRKAADLLAVASRYPSFPMLLETTRECINDVFDVPALRSVLTDLRSRKMRVVTVDMDQASPFARSLVFGWIAQYMYEGDAPLAERRATALSLDRELLRDLLGAEQLRELLDPEVLAQLETELQRTADGWQASTVEGVEDLLRWLGPLEQAEVAERCEMDPSGPMAQLVAERRAIEVSIGSRRCVASAEDAARLRDALGVTLPQGLPAAFTDPVAQPVVDLVHRFTRTNGPFLMEQVVARTGLNRDQAEGCLADLERQGRLVRGEFRPEGVEREWCHVDVLRVLRRRSLAALRAEVEPVEQEVLARFMADWQHVGSSRRGLDGLGDIVTSLSGAALPASVLERDILPSRMADYRPADLDSLLTSGQLVWVGARANGTADGRVRLVWRDQFALLPGSADHTADGPIQLSIRACLETRGAVFWTDLVDAVAGDGLDYEDSAVLGALWDLVWAGEVTNDSFSPVRALIAGGGPAAKKTSTRRRGPGMRGLSRLGPPAGGGRWSLVSALVGEGASQTVRSMTMALAMLERYGVVTREMASAEGIEGGFAGIYPVFKELEERGQARRGYFVDGLGAAQFALPGAVDRLRDLRPGPDGSDETVMTLAATDPAQPYGAALSWPYSAGHPSRSIGSYVVLAGGNPLVYLARGAKSIVVFPAASDDDRWAVELAGLVKSRRVRSIEVQKVDGGLVSEYPEVSVILLAAGFKPGYKGPILR